MMNKTIITLSFLSVVYAVIAQNNFPADVNHIVGYGQSLSLGSSDKMSINTSGLPYKNIFMFDNGLRYRRGEQDSSLGSYVPLVEHREEETPTSGMADMMMRSIASAELKEVDYLFRTPGWGGVSIQYLKRNDSIPEYYQAFMRGVRRGKQIADQKGKSFNVPLFTWTQGEADVFAEMDSETYQQNLRELCKDVNEDVREITGQLNEVKCIMYQTASHNRYYHITNREDRKKNPHIAIAQYQLAKSIPGFYMATPMYPFDYYKDNTHLRAEYARLLGAYYGYVASKVLVDQVDWKPIHPERIEAKGNKLVLTMHVPVPPLVLDTDWVQEIDNYGFNIYRNGREIGIKKVGISKANEITITCAESLHDGDRLTYAINGENTGRFIGARGNIRDSQGDHITYDIGSKRYHLHNWLPIFEEEIIITE